MIKHKFMEFVWKKIINSYSKLYATYGSSTGTAIVMRSSVRVLIPASCIISRISYILFGSHLLHVISIYHRIGQNIFKQIQPIKYVQMMRLMTFYSVRSMQLDAFKKKDPFHEVSHSTTYIQTLDFFTTKIKFWGDGELPSIHRSPPSCLWWTRSIFPSATNSPVYIFS